MSRRIVVSLAALLGVLGVLLVPTAGQATPALPASSLAVAIPGTAVAPQVGLPPVVDVGALLRAVLASFPPFLRDILRPLFDFLIGQFCILFNNCASP